MTNSNSTPSINNNDIEEEHDDDSSLSARSTTSLNNDLTADVDVDVDVEIDVDASTCHDDVASSSSNEGQQQQQQQQQQRWIKSIVLSSLCWLSLGCILQYGWIANDGKDIVDIFTEFYDGLMMNNNNNLEEEEEKEYEIQELSSSSSSSKSSSTLFNKPFRYDSPVKFIFVIGLEGTGHHLFEKLVENGPMNHRVDSLKLQKQRGWIHKYLWDGMSNGLWAARCNKNNNVTSTISYKSKLTSKLVAIKNILENQYEKHVIYFVNTLDPFEHFGMISYPNFETSYCRFLNYPNLDLWYEICNDAQVDCEHVYIYRDPIQLLHSTTIKRTFNPTIIEGIYQYYTMYGIIASQLHMWNNRTIGCYGFYENTTISWYEGLRPLLGYKNSTKKERKECKSMIQNTYNLEPINSSFIIPDQYNMYMKSLYTIHNDVLRICQNK